MYTLRFACLMTVGLALAGCTRSADVNTRLPPEPLPSSPTEPVQTGDLPVVDPDVQVAGQNSAAPATPEVQEQPALASNEPAKPSGEKITREGMAGSWNVPSDNAECRIILAFTKWSGGYRAATRRCNSPEIAAVTAWDVKGQQVVLVDGAGSTVARLFSSGNARYDGSLNSGTKITFTR